MAVTNKIAERVANRFASKLEEIMSPGLKWLQEKLARADITTPNAERAARSLDYGRGALDFSRQYPDLPVPPPGFPEHEIASLIFKQPELQAMRKETQKALRAYKNSHPGTTTAEATEVLRPFFAKHDEAFRQQMVPLRTIDKSGSAQLRELQDAARAKAQIDAGDYEVPPFGVGWGWGEPGIYANVAGKTPYEKIRNGWKLYDEYLKNGAGLSGFAFVPSESGLREAWNPLDSLVAGAAFGGMTGGIPGAIAGGAGGLLLDSLMEAGQGAYNEYVAPRAAEYGRNFVFYPPSMEEYY